MPIVTHCPKCRATFNLPDGLAGKNAKCSRCQQVFLVPAAPPCPTTFRRSNWRPARRPHARARPPPVAPRRLRRSPARSSGIGWIIALAVGVPLLLFVGLIILIAAVGAYYYFAALPPAAPAVSVVTPNPVPVPPPPNDPAPNPVGPVVPPVQPVAPTPPREPPPALKPPAPLT